MKREYTKLKSIDSGRQKQKPHWKTLSYAAMLLISVSVITSCVSPQPLRIQTIPVLPTPIIPHLPAAPDLASQLPKPVVVTAVEAEYYKEACSAWEGGEYDAEEMATLYKGMSRSASCDWAIYGQTVQGQLTTESIMIQQAAYVEGLRAHIDSLMSIINSMLDVSAKTQEALDKMNDKPDPKPSLWKRLF